MVTHSGKLRLVYGFLLLLFLLMKMESEHLVLKFYWVYLICINVVLIIYLGKYKSLRNRIWILRGLQPDRYRFYLT